MATRHYVNGTIDITPPITPAEIEHGHTDPETHSLHVHIADPTVGLGVDIRYQGAEGSWDGSWYGGDDELADMVQTLVDAYRTAPDGTPRTFTGFLDCVAYLDEGDSPYRIAVVDGKARTFDPAVIWPPEAGGQVADNGHTITLPTQIDLVSPGQPHPVREHRACDGKWALVVGDLDDGAVFYPGTYQQLDHHATAIRRAVDSAQHPAALGSAVRDAILQNARAENERLSRMLDEANAEADRARAELRAVRKGGKEAEAGIGPDPFGCGHDPEGDWPHHTEATDENDASVCAVDGLPFPCPDAEHPPGDRANDQGDGPDDGKVLIAGVLYDEATGEEAEPVQDDDRQCRQCQDTVQTLSSDDLCDGCVAEQADAIYDGSLRVESQVDVLDALYDAVDDGTVGWLDDLVAKAGLIWRCGDGCGYRNPAAVDTCEACGWSRPGKCRWCGQEIRKAPTTDEAHTAGTGWHDEEGSAHCENYIDGCRACDDGEAHPHEPAEKEAVTQV